MAQTFHSFELLICDDASTDNTLEILEQYAEKDKRIRILRHETNQRALIARNDLVRAAKGKYCIFADADDYILPSFFETAAENLKKKHYDIIQYSFELNSDADKKDAKMGYFKNEELFGKDIIETYLNRYPLIFAPYAKTYSREVLLKALPPEKKVFLIDDFELTMRAVFFAESYKSESRIVYHYNLGAGNCGTKNWSLEKIEKYIQSLAAVLADTISFFQKNNCPDSYKIRMEEIICESYNRILLNGTVSEENKIQSIGFILQNFGKYEGNVILLNKYTSLFCMLKFNWIFFKFFIKRNFLRMICKKKWMDA